MSFPITPPNSSPIGGSRKRSRDDFDEITSPKRWQDTKIHSEVHKNTIQIMLQAQKELQQRELQPNNNQEQMTELLTNQELEQSQFQSSYKQAPYWPVINRVKH